MKWLFLGFLFVNIAVAVNAACYLSEHQIRNEWRVLIKYENKQLELLREPKVEDGTVLYMVCNNNDITEVTCENGQFNTQLPLPYCSQPLRPELKIENNRNLCPYTLYRLGFQIHCKADNYFFEAYKTCFDHSKMRTVFTINEAYPFVLRRPDGMRFDPDEIFTMRYFSAYNKRDIYAQFNNILGPQQRFMPPDAGDTRIDRGHLTPVGDYITNTLMSTTFKLINAIPQFHTINDGNWKNMEEWARNSINTPSKVCSGALEWVLQLPDGQGNLRSIYLRDNVIPVPLWTYKIVLNRHNIRTVFLTYNNIHDNIVPPPIPQQICQQVECPSNIYLQNSNYQGYTYCCDHTHFLKFVVPNLRGHC